MADVAIEIWGKAAGGREAAAHLVFVCCVCVLCKCVCDQCDVLHLSILPGGTCQGGQPNQNPNLEEEPFLLFAKGFLSFAPLFSDSYS